MAFIHFPIAQGHGGKMVLRPFLRQGPDGPGECIGGQHRLGPEVPLPVREQVGRML